MHEVMDEYFLRGVVEVLREPIHIYNSIPYSMRVFTSAPPAPYTVEDAVGIPRLADDSRPYLSTTRTKEVI